MSEPDINKYLDGIVDVRLINVVQTEQVHLIQRIKQPYLFHGVEEMVKDTSAANKQVTPPPLSHTLRGPNSGCVIPGQSVHNQRIKHE